ncbi:putative AlkP superfamily pyrophosphatase or phosphodiesterase [Saonia flava]|uniref:Putative AlkP superfamily pyrophosphatase or phosphodiesterase n=1 Tax=Saonia flava TaxID=523696 RepID=A0A846QTX9_9FLAO|nr:ectonucleotide pyrophosphatase/phosphodiesterase [Saonia flava]NJB70687.1 putative AlkP superfamily pyrophosphatase or phosphodiesterase [Saonia flava]
MTKRNFIHVLIFIFLTIILFSCKSVEKIVDGASTTNSKTALKKPYLILVSLDGFRWDYVERFNPPNLINFIKNGVKAESLIPSFPSKTFPNHYTIATGMYPDHHGILGNYFYSYKKDQTYAIRNREMVEDGSFYGGIPIWVQADKAGMVSASYFFVGTEADIQGIKPTYHYTYNASIKNEVRVAQALDWLALPPKTRPHIITLYFSDMDDVGHRLGPNSDEELKKALYKLDKNLGDLIKGVNKTGLPVNIMIVSDHGMANVKTTNFIPIEEVLNDTMFSVIDNGAILNVHPKEGVLIDSVYQYLKQKEKNFKVYKTKDTPGFEYVPENKDWGAIQIIPDFGYYFLRNKIIESRKKSLNTTFGIHGYDPKYKEMHGIFYANGPSFKKGHTIPSVKNIHLYPLMCTILGLDIPDTIDGKISELKDTLRSTD